MFANFGATLPAPTLFVVAVSEFFVQWWWAMLAAGAAGGYFLRQSWRRSEKVQAFMDRALLRVPVFGGLVEKSVVARWTRTMSTLFAAGVPLVEALDSVGGASGNSLYATATEQIQRDVSAGGSLTNAMQSAGVFPVMVLQMAAIGEESGSLDQMLGKAAEFYEEEVDQMVKGLSSLMEPFVLVFLGGIIAAIVISMYLPLFKLGAVV
jgi:type IV pilus assembly protein PilC